jgi:protein SCO1/2
MSKVLPTLLVAASLTAALSSAQDGPASRVDGEGKRLIPFVLTDQNGKKFSFTQDAAGRPVLLTFIFTRCPGACPFVVESCLGAARKVAASKGATAKPLVVAVSFDPEFDTPEVLRAYATERQIPPGEVVFLTGDPKKVARVVKAYEVGVGKDEKGEIFHGFVTLVIDKDGRIVSRYFGYAIDEKSLLADAERSAR